MENFFPNKDHPENFPEHPPLPKKIPQDYFPCENLPSATRVSLTARGLLAAPFTSARTNLLTFTYLLW